MKLEFILIEVDTGDEEVLKIGKGNWISFANITNFQKAFIADNIQVNDEQSFLIFFRYIPEGLLLGLSRRMNADRASVRSNETMWIFINRKISLSEKNIDDIIKATKFVLNDRSALLDGSETFEQLAPKVLTQDYPELERPFYTEAMKGTEFAVVDCKDVTPAQVIEKGYQPDLYKEYGYIILNQSGVRPEGVRVIQPYSLKKLVWVKAPKELPENLHTNDEVQYSVNNQPIPENGRYCPEGRYTISLSRRGYGPINIGAEVKDGNSYFDFTDAGIYAAKWYKEFNTRNLHFVRDNGTTIESGFSMSSPDALNAKGQPITNFSYGTTIYIPESRLKDFRLTIQGDRIKRLDKVLDLTKERIETIQVSLLKDKIDFHQSFDGNLVVVNIEGLYGKRLSKEGLVFKDEKIYKLDTYLANSKSPREGKEESVDSAKLKKELTKKSQLVKILTVLSGLLITAFIVFLVLFLWKDHEDKVSQPDSPPAQQSDPPAVTNPDQGEQQEKSQGETTEDTPDPEYTIDKAIIYLDTNKNWEKDNMEKYPDLRGLYADLNNFELNKIVKEWNNKLEKSTKFKKLVESAKKNLNNKWNPKQEEHNPTYNKDTDLIINVENYTNWIDQDRSPKSSGSSTVSTTKSSKESGKTTNSEEKTQEQIKEENSKKY